MKLIVGLGNPGKRYRHTPHNIGFMVLDKLACVKKSYFRKRRWGAELAEFKTGLEKVILAKPWTFMNLSGIAVIGILKYKRIKRNDILVICDDINLPLGQVRIREHGSDGGHLGLRSIVENLGTEDFARLRIGVGKEKIVDVSRYVLAKFSKEDLELVEGLVDTAVDAVLFFLRNGIGKTMSEFN